MKLIKAHLDTQNQGVTPPGTTARPRTLILTVTLEATPAAAERVLDAWMHKREVDLYIVANDAVRYANQHSYGDREQPLTHIDMRSDPTAAKDS